MICLFQESHQSTMDSPLAGQESCIKAWDESTPANLYEAFQIIWRAIAPEQLWLEIDGFKKRGFRLDDLSTFDSDRDYFDAEILAICGRWLRDIELKQNRVNPSYTPLTFGL
jgi:hypothetical protein